MDRPNVKGVGFMKKTGWMSTTLVAIFAFIAVGWYWLGQYDKAIFFMLWALAWQAERIMERMKSDD